MQQEWHKNEIERAGNHFMMMFKMRKDAKKRKLLMLLIDAHAQSEESTVLTGVDLLVVMTLIIIMSNFHLASSESIHFSLNSPVLARGFLCQVTVVRCIVRRA